MPERFAEEARELLIEWRRMRYLPEEKLEGLLAAALSEVWDSAIEECAKICNENGNFVSRDQIRALRGGG